MRIGKLYFHWQLSKPYFVRPEHADQAWQLALGFFTITRMDDKHYR